MHSELFKTENYIAGRWVKSENGCKISVYNPASSEQIGEIPDCGESRTLSAIESARYALPAWKALPAEKRSQMLYKLYELIMANVDELAKILTEEQGKPLAEAAGEIQYGAKYIKWYAEEALRVYGSIIPASFPNKRIAVTKEPIGICAAITPWNFPQAMLARKMAPALACGCTFISKPAPETPYSALALAALVDKAEFPPGVFNVITGDAETIAHTLMKAKEVRKVSFTGSTEVGKILIRQSADTVKKLTLELGGNAPFIVFEDADISAAVTQAIAAKHRNCGQVCISINRILLHKSVHDKFVSAYSEAVKKLKVGDGTEEGVDIGPLISTEALDKVKRLACDAVKCGAKVAAGKIPEDDSLLIEPVVLTGATKDMDIFKEEIFGPVSTIYSFNSEEEALELANDTDYGLAAYFFTRDLGRSHRVAEALQYGMIGVNDAAISAIQAPFGGVKFSGFGREGGSYGIEEYLVTKYCSIAL